MEGVFKRGRDVAKVGGTTNFVPPYTNALGLHCSQHHVSWDTLYLNY